MDFSCMSYALTLQWLSTVVTFFSTFLYVFSCFLHRGRVGRLHILYGGYIHRFEHGKLFTRGSQPLSCLISIPLLACHSDNCYIKLVQPDRTENIALPPFFLLSQCHELRVLAARSTVMKHVIY